MSKQKLKQFFKAIKNHDEARLVILLDEFGPEVR